MKMWCFFNANDYYLFNMTIIVYNKLQNTLLANSFEYFFPSRTELLKNANNHRQLSDTVYSNRENGVALKYFTF